MYTTFSCLMCRFCKFYYRISTHKELRHDLSAWATILTLDRCEMVGVWSVDESPGYQYIGWRSALCLLPVL